MSEDGPELERREGKRYKVSWISHVLLPGKRILAARARNVSADGVGFELDEAPRVDLRIGIELRSWCQGKRYNIREKGVITYSLMLGGTGFSHGLKFTFIPPEHLVLLKEVLQLLAPASP